MSHARVPSGVSKKKKKPPKQPPVELGFAEPIDSLQDAAEHHSAAPNHHLQSQFFPSKIGGTPSWLALDPLPNPSNLLCQSCQLPCAFLMQIYAPVSSRDDAFHRTLFIFICLDPQCYQQNNSSPIVVFRSQLPRANPFYGFEPLDPDFWDPVVDSEMVKTVWDYSSLCMVCGCKGSLRCGRCHALCYCSKEHQELHWKRGHKASCQRKKKADFHEHQNDNDSSSEATQIAGIVNNHSPASKTVRLVETIGTTDAVEVIPKGLTIDTDLSEEPQRSPLPVLPSVITSMEKFDAEQDPANSVKYKVASGSDLSRSSLQRVWSRTDGNIFLFPEMELVTEPEVWNSGADDSQDQMIAKEPERTEELRVADFEKYIKEHKDVGLNNSKDNLDALEELSVRQDKAFKEFSRRVASNPEQVIRYQRGGKPLLANSLTVAEVSKDSTKKDPKMDLRDGVTVPPCENCSSRRIFEFQVMPHFLSLLGVDDVRKSIDWATLLVYTCETSCSAPSDQSYLKEYIVKQDFV